MTTESLTPVASREFKGEASDSLSAHNTILKTLKVPIVASTLEDLDTTTEGPVVRQFLKVAGKRQQIGWARLHSVSKKWIWYLDQAFRASEPSDETPTGDEDSKSAPVGVKQMTATRIWLDEQMNSNKLHERVAGIVKRRVLESYEEILSTVGLWFAQWGAKGTFDEFLAKGKPPSAGTLASWVGQKLQQDRYKNGTDAQGRHSTGAKTHCEVSRNRKASEKGEVQLLMPNAEKLDPDSPVVVNIRPKLGDSSAPQGVFDLVASHPEEDATELEALQRSLARDIIQVQRGCAEPYSRVFEHFSKGTSKEEAAQLEGLTPLRVGSMYKNIRSDLLGAPVLVELALRILAAVTQEPWSELAELESEADPKMLPRVQPAIQLLKQRGLVEERDQSFAPTRAGRDVNSVGFLV